MLAGSTPKVTQPACLVVLGKQTGFNAWMAAATSASSIAVIYEDDGIGGDVPRFQYEIRCLSLRSSSLRQGILVLCEGPILNAP